MKIEVRPIDKKKWHGKTGKDNFTRPKKFQVLVNSDTMLYDTGLTEEDIDMLKNKHNINYDLSPNFNPEKAHPFWDSSTSTFKMLNATMFFDTTKGLDFIKIKNMKASKFIANSQAEYEQGLYPEATHVMIDETEEVELKATKIAIKKKAIVESTKISRDKKIQLIMIIGGKNIRGKSDGLVEVELDKLLEKNSKDVLRYIQMDDTEVSLHSMVLECLQKSILRKEGHKIFYHDSVLGGDVFDVIKYLKSDENQDLKLRLMSAVTD